LQELEAALDVGARAGRPRVSQAHPSAVLPCSTSARAASSAAAGMRGLEGSLPRICSAPRTVPAKLRAAKSICASRSRASSAQGLLGYSTATFWKARCISVVVRAMEPWV
jgi:hypothetical protein